MACGVAVIAASTIGSVKDLIVDSKTGFVFAAGNPEDLASRLEILARSPTLRKSIIEEAKRTILDWGYQQTASEMEAALRFISERCVEDNQD